MISARVKPAAPAVRLLWLNEVRLEDRPQVGGKAALLGELCQAGLPVPDGFCLPAGLLKRGAGEAWPVVVEAYRRLAAGSELVVVRSSGVEEDGLRRSFAGQFETVLNVRSEDELWEAILRCLASWAGERVHAYQPQHHKHSPGMALIVQRQIPARVSGVLFTSHPVSGASGAVWIEAGSGPGGSLLSGKVRPARMTLDDQGRLVEKDGPGMLTLGQALRLQALARRVEAVLGPGQDIEWALGEGPEGEEMIFLLQARPVTTGPQRAALSQLWTRANVGEVLPHVVTPLTWSVFRAALLSRLPAHNSQESEDAEEGIRRIGGRVYLRVDALLDSFCYLPGVTPQVMSKVLGVELPASAGSYQPPQGLAVKLAGLAFHLDALGILPRLGWLARRMRAMPSADPGHLPELLAWTAAAFRLHLKATAYAIGAFAWLAHIAGGKDLLLLLVGDEDLQTAAQGRQLWRLGRLVEKSPALVDLLLQEQDWPETAARAASRAGGEEFLAAFQEFLDQHGSRAADEFELAVPRWREDPSFVLQVLRQHLSGSASDPQLARAQRLQSLSGILENMGSGLKGWQRRRLGRWLAAYRRYTAQRENLKYRLIEGFAGLRAAFLALGQDLAAAGVLAARQDVFYLTLPEIYSLLAHQRAGKLQDSSGLQDRIQERRAQGLEWQAQRPPGLVWEAGAGEWDVPERTNQALTGIGCSPGRVQGVARVLLNPHSASTLRPGEILVAPHTDPGWTPLFLNCKAVVTEIGGFLSHGAIVAREFGIPCVVNVPEATRRIQTGDLIWVDGSTGHVFLRSTLEGVTASRSAALIIESHPGRTGRMKTAGHNPVIMHYH